MTIVRRDLLRLAGTGLAGATLGAHAQSATMPGSGTTAVFDVKAYGAKGDGASIDTPAINKAIEAASAQGGATVRFPAGTYACYSIHLKSHVALYLDPGATILAADLAPGGSGSYDPAEPNTPWEDYQDYGHNHWHNSLIWGEGIHDAAILGPGLIWGKGLSRGGSQEPRAEPTLNFPGASRMPGRSFTWTTSKVLSSSVSRPQRLSARPYSRLKRLRISASRYHETSKTFIWKKLIGGQFRIDR